jgi:hypothetical protein
MAGLPRLHARSSGDPRQPRLAAPGAGRPEPLPGRRARAPPARRPRALVEGQASCGGFPRPSLEATPGLADERVAGVPRPAGEPPCPYPPLGMARSPTFARGVSVWTRIVAPCSGQGAEPRPARSSRRLRTQRSPLSAPGTATDRGAPQACRAAIPQAPTTSPCVPAGSGGPSVCGRRRRRALEAHGPLVDRDELPTFGPTPRGLLAGVLCPPRVRQGYDDLTHLLPARCARVRGVGNRTGREGASAGAEQHSREDERRVLPGVHGPSG